MEKNKTVFVMIDIQERFRKVINGFDDVVKNALILSKASDILGVSLVVTEQNSVKLGKTVIDLPKCKTIDKMSFNCFGSKEFSDAVNDYDDIVIFGIESHVCVFQTALNAVSKGFRVYVVADAISSRNEDDKIIALERMMQSGVLVETTEMVLFQLIEKAGTPEFKKLLELIK